MDRTKRFVKVYYTPICLVNLVCRRVSTATSRGRSRQIGNERIARGALAHKTQTDREVHQRERVAVRLRELRGVTDARDDIDETHDEGASPGLGAGEIVDAGVQADVVRDRFAEEISHGTENARTGHAHLVEARKGCALKHEEGHDETRTGVRSLRMSSACADGNQLRNRLTFNARRPPIER